eukprot:4105014-Amphidinium_carterae.2
MVFMMIAFVTAFWALDREMADELRAWEVLMLLFTASDFVERQSITSIKNGVQYRWALGDALLGAN